MGEPWIFLWVIGLLGLFVIGLAVYDYLDRKKRGERERSVTSCVIG